MKYDVVPLRDQMLDVLRHAWPQYLFDWDYLQKRTEDLEKVYLRQECFDLSFAHPEPGTSIDHFFPIPCNVDKFSFSNGMNVHGMGANTY